jgi:hypothetical protein
VSSIWCEVLLLFSAVAVVVLVVAEEQQITGVDDSLHSFLRYSLLQAVCGGWHCLKLLCWPVL